MVLVHFTVGVEDIQLDHSFVSSLCVDNTVEKFLWVPSVLLIL